MLFNSFTFVAFFAAVLLLHNLPFSWKAKKFNLLLASYLFYAAWNPPLIALLWISTLVDWFAGRAIDRSDRPSVRRTALVASLLTNLGLLAFFKYGGFVLENFTAAVQNLGFDYAPAQPSIVLPMGISFYTFQTLTYTIDIYRRRLSPSRSFLDYALYVTFFPQLVAGPIVRAGEFLPQLRTEPRVSGNAFAWGLALLTLGLFQKVVLADAFLSVPADEVFAHRGFLAPLDAWAGVLAFSGQIFCDFAGYSTCAIGAALCLGLSLPDNFRFPYAAVGFSDFWRRWHVTLSSWLRDYLYIPLGGNRRGTPRTLINLMLTMLLGGLWHGAAWTFVVWGGLHGLYLVAERALVSLFGGRKWTRSKAARLLFALLTFFCVAITWVFFRADSFGSAWSLLRSMFGVVPEPARILRSFDLVAVGVVTGGILLSHWLLRDFSREELAARTPWWLIAVVWTFMLVTIILTQGGGDAFIYFQF